MNIGLCFPSLKCKNVKYSLQVWRKLPQEFCISLLLSKSLHQQQNVKTFPSLKKFCLVPSVVCDLPIFPCLASLRHFRSVVRPLRTSQNVLQYNLPTQHSHRAPENEIEALRTAGANHSSSPLLPLYPAAHSPHPAALLYHFFIIMSIISS